MRLVTLERQDGNDLAIRIDGKLVRGSVVLDGESVHVFAFGTHTVLQYRDPLAHAAHAEAEGGRLTAPMPGKIVAVLVKKGESVEKGKPLLIMEAMKMEHTIAAPHDGIVEELLYVVGDQVEEGKQLLAFKQ
jgi:3-methylcrotonyl-CoA carboxylase alpha subunit